MNEDEYQKQREQALDGMLDESEINQIVAELDIDEAMKQEFNLMLQDWQRLNVEYQALKRTRTLYFRGYNG